MVERRKKDEEGSIKEQGRVTKQTKRRKGGEWENEIKREGRRKII